MKTIIALPNGETTINAVAGITTLLEFANAYKEPPQFDILIATEKKEKARSLGRYSVKADATFGEIKEADLVIIPPIVGDRRLALTNSRPMIKWMVKMRLEQNTQLASVCTGAYLLAATGLLNGKEASSHFDVIPEVKRLFPEVVWMPDKIMTDKDGLYTSGGAFSSLNLILHLIEKFVDKDVAIAISKEMQIDMHRRSQAPFMIFNNQKSHEDEVIQEVQAYLENHFAENISLDSLSQQFGMSRRNLIRRFKQATGNPPKTYLQRLRIEKAKRLFEQTTHNVNEAMFAVGYTDVNTFRRIFKRHAGCLPSAYRSQYKG